MTMNRRKLNLITIIVMITFGGAFSFGLFLFYINPDLYAAYRDLVLLIIAIPASVLAYSFQRRSEFIQVLRTLWLHMIDGAQAGFRYTYTPKPSPELYTETLSKLSIVIEEIRSVFKNVREKQGNVGLYPFESMKEIHKTIEKLGYGERVTEALQREARNNINNQWKVLRSKFLLEFDRDSPTHPQSKYLIEGEKEDEERSPGSTP